MKYVFSVLVGLLAFNPIFSGEYNIRLVVLKHCSEAMAEQDAQLVIDALKEASKKGLSIKFLDKYIISQKLTKEQWTKLWSTVMAQDAQEDDTLIVFTVGHGFPTGNLAVIGPRAEFLETLAECALKNKQKILWWQLSCFASSGLTEVSKLPEEQQKYVILVPSTPTDHQSSAGVQGLIFGKVLTSLLDDSADVNKDGVISVEELREVINKYDNLKRGRLIKAYKEDHSVFKGK